MTKPDLDSIAQGIFELGHIAGPISTEPEKLIPARVAGLLGSALVYVGYLVAYLAENGYDAVALAEIYEGALEDLK